MTAPEIADAVLNPALTDALWAWLAADGRLDDFAAECLDDDALFVDPQQLADWAEDAIRDDADDLAGAVLLAACRLADWRELTGRAEEALEV